jgi:hypothetical protein
VAFLKNALPSSGESERSISASGMVESLSQLVPERFFEAMAFISFAFPDFGVPESPYV